MNRLSGGTAGGSAVGRVGVVVGILDGRNIRAVRTLLVGTVRVGVVGTVMARLEAVLALHVGAAGRLNRTGRNVRAVVAVLHEGIVRAGRAGRVGRNDRAVRAGRVDRNVRAVRAGRIGRNVRAGRVVGYMGRAGRVGRAVRAVGVGGIGGIIGPDGLLGRRKLNRKLLLSPATILFRRQVNGWYVLVERRAAVPSFRRVCDRNLCRSGPGQAYVGFGNGSWRSESCMGVW